MSPVKEIRCSGLARPMNCPGFVFMTDLPPNVGNAAAAAGTACGELLTAMLVQRTVKPQINKVATNGVLFDEDMWFYASEVANDIFKKATSEITSEDRIDWITQSGIKIRGSYDASYTSGTALHVDDLKYGWGIVDVKENWQLLAYAIGEVIKRNQAFEKIVLTIRQPRPHHEDGPVRSWTLSYGELLNYKDKIEKRMMEISQGHSAMQTGKHCKYCKAAGSCAALNKAVYNGVDIAFDQAVQDHLSDDQLSRELDTLERASELLYIRKDSLTELAINRIKGGKVVPNYSIETSFGNRTWKKNVSPDVLEMLTGKVVTEKKLLSPAKIEKLGVDKKFISSLTERYNKGSKVKRVDTNAMADKIFNNKGDS